MKVAVVGAVLAVMLVLLPRREAPAVLAEAVLVVMVAV
jgi:hypothetical protein